MSSAFSNFGAAPAAAGYLYQARMALLLCLPYAKTGADLEVSIERLDDVAFSSGEQPVELLSFKHHLRRPASLTDASPDLWKTIRIWADAILLDPSLPQRTRLLLMTTAEAPPGSVASMLRPSPSSPLAAKPTLAAAHHALVEVAENSSNAELRAAFTSFLALPFRLRMALLSAMEVLDRQPMLPDLDALLEHELRMNAPTGKAREAREMLEGWWWPRVCRALSASEPELIPIAAVEARLDEVAERLRRDALVAELEHVEPTEEDLAGYDDMRFVDQLKQVGIGPLRIGYAKQDYYRAFTQRSRWTRRNVVLDEELKDFERTLISEWRPRHAAMCERLDEHSDPAAMRAEGNALYGWVETSARFPLRALTSKALNVGSFHMLANESRVGWHRDFERLGGEDR